MQEYFNRRSWASHVTLRIYSGLSSKGFNVFSQSLWPLAVRDLYCATTAALTRNFGGPNFLVFTICKDILPRTYTN